MKCVISWAPDNFTINLIKKAFLRVSTLDLFAGQSSYSFTLQGEIIEEYKTRTGYVSHSCLVVLWSSLLSISSLSSVRIPQSTSEHLPQILFGISSVNPILTIAYISTNLFRPLPKLDRLKQANLIKTQRRITCYILTISLQIDYQVQKSSFFCFRWVFFFIPPCFPSTPIRYFCVSLCSASAHIEIYTIILIICYWLYYDIDKKHFYYFNFSCTHW